jgi:hypothetical protein
MNTNALIACVTGADCKIARVPASTAIETGGAMCCCNKSENKVKDPVCGVIIDPAKMPQPVSAERHRLK